MSQFSGSTFGNYSRNVLIILGVIFLVVGIGMIVGLGSIPFAGGTMVLTGGIFVAVAIALIVVGLFVGRGAAATQRVLQTGVAGTATITGLSQTGVYMNQQPQIGMDLLVSLPGQAAYPAHHREIVPLLLLSRLAPGASLPVRIDPANPQKIVIDWQASSGMSAAPMANMAAMQQMAAAQQMAAQPGAPGMPAAMSAPGSQMDESLAQVQAALASSPGGMQVAQPFATAQQGQYTVEQLRTYLRQSGLEAKAHVDKLEDTGKIVGDERVYNMGMTLSIPGKLPQKLPPSAAMVPVGVSHKLFQGMSVPVRYAAENPNLLMVEWDKI